MSAVEFYNPAIKNKYIETIDNEGTRSLIKYIFKASKSTEEILEMDLYDFSIDHIEQVLKNANTKSLVTARTNGSLIKSYINWCITNGYRENNLNPLDAIVHSWYKKFVDDNIKQFISKEELDEIVDGLVNYQDKIIPVLLFHGVYGTESSEIRNLKLSDIKSDGTVRLYDDKKGERFLKLDEEVINLLYEAHDEKEYLNKNGTAAERTSKSELLDSEYIVKTIKRGKGLPNQRVSQMTVIKRIDVTKEYFGYPDLTLKSINRSGMLYYASKLIGDKEELTQEDFEIIGERFNLSKITNNGYTYYNTTYLRNFINRKNIEMLYGEDLK